MDRLLGILLFALSLYYAYKTIKNPPSGLGSGRRTYIIKDLFISFFLLVLAILLLFKLVTISEIF